ncbi:hypothetical protein [Microbulbifer sp. JTAC008]|uniref:hypothetical protein n=1 Tax=unclassified Microbulbifer TaxID=2619833 RepID=UPI0040390526
MTNPYVAPNSDVNVDADNNSGQKSDIVPEGVKGWSWGAFFLNWIWAAFNKTYIGLLALIPYIGFIVAIYLGIKGRELAWKNKQWESVEHFNSVQKKWSVWGVCLILIPFALGIVLAVALPAYMDYQNAVGAQ